MHTFINNLIATLTHRNKGVTSWSYVGFCVVKGGGRSFFGFLGAFASSALLLGFLTLSTASDTLAAPNYQMNYQGKLTNASNVAVADGTYNMRFWLLTSPSIATTSALWSESLTGTNRVQVTNGLFSVMLGSTSPLTGVDFNQTLYLGVEIGSTTGSAAWDGEMSPRKVLGTVPAAFEANKLDGLDSTQFVRTDATSSIATSSASTLLTLTQSGAGDIFNLFDGTTEVFTLTDGGRMGLGTTSPSRLFTMQGGDFWLGGNMTATGTAVFNALTVSASSTLGYASTTALTVANNAYLNTFTATAGTTTNATSSNLAVTTFKIGSDVITDITGTNLSVTNGVLNAASTADGVSNWSYNGTRLTPTSTTAGLFVNASSTIGNGTATGGLTISGGATTTGNAYFAGLLGIGTTTPSARFAIEHEAGSTGFAFLVSTSTSGSATSTAFVIDSNGRVGIGTSSPSQELTVRGSISAGNQLLGRSSVSVTTPAFSWIGDTNTGMYRPGADIIGFTTGGFERARINTNGDTTFQANLDVANIFSAARSVFGSLAIGTSTTATPSSTFYTFGGSSPFVNPLGTTFFSDDFNASTNTNLESWVPGIGSGWTILIQDGLIAMRAQTTGYADATTTLADSGVLYTADGTYASADYEVSVETVTTDSIDDVAIIAARIQDANNFYMVKFSATAANIVLYKRVGGVYTTLASTPTLGVASGSKIKLRIVGNNLTVYRDSTLLLSAQDSDITLPGKAGIGVGDVGALSTDDADTTWNLDNFLVTGYEYPIATAVFEGGNVGIGTTSPSRLLTVIGDAYFDGNIISASSTLGYASSTALTVANNAYLNTFTATAGTTTNATSSNLAVTTFKIGSDVITDITGSGLQNTGNALTCITATGAAFGCLTSTDWTTFMGKVASSSIDTSSELATLVTDETGTGSLVFSASPIFTGTPTFANLYMSPTGTSTLGYASTTALTVANNAYLNTYTANAGTTTNATSSNLAVTTFKIGSDVITDITGTNLSVTNGVLNAASTADGVSNWSYNGTRLTPTSTTAGLFVNASSTIGNGTATGGLTISGGATTTGNAYFAGLLGIATTTPSATLSLTGTGETNLFAFASSTNHNLLTLNARGALTFGTSTTRANIYINGGGTTTEALTSYDNIAIGNLAFSYTAGAYDSIAIGYQALYGSSSVPMTGDDNNAIGWRALMNNTTGTYNNAIGSNALKFNTSGSFNIANGTYALFSNATGTNNTANGARSLYSNTIGSYNTADGRNSLYSNTTGSFNQAFGYKAGYNMTTGTSTLFLGSMSDTLNGTISSSTAIGAGALLARSNTMVLGGTGANSVDIVTGTSSPWAKLSIQNNYGSTTALLDIATTTSASFATSSIFRVNHDGNVGIGTTTPTQKLTVVGTIQSTVLLGGATGVSTDVSGNIIRDPSDARLKTNVNTIENSLEKVLQLRGVSFNWIDGARFGEQTEIGFIAQEVDVVLPEVVRKGGEYWSLNTRNIVAVVVEAIKELYQKITETDSRVQDLETRVQELEILLNQQQSGGTNSQSSGGGTGATSAPNDTDGSETTSTEIQNDPVAPPVETPPVIQGPEEVTEVPPESTLSEAPTI